MSPATRVRVLVGTAAVAAAGVVAGVVLATRQDSPQPKAQCASAPQPLLVPGVPTTHATEVREAILQPAKKAALALEPLAQDNPRDPVVQFNYGVALFCAGYLNEASQAFRAAKTVGRNTFYEMRADEILHPQYFSPQDGLYPLFQPIRPDPLLIRGVVQQRQGHQHSAERLYRRAASARPNDDEAQVAAAVGLFDEDNLSASFSRLGPLVKRFPASQSVRYHLGLLLAWTGQRDQAIAEFRLARSLGAGTSLGKQAETFLHGLVSNGTKGQSR